MIQITKNIALKSITLSDTTALYLLMKEVYPLAYKHFWKDDGTWYVENQYSKENIEKELSETESSYYFVLFNNEIVGNLRIIWNQPLHGLEAKKSVKLHRIYLHASTHGKGVGKQLISWIETRAKSKGFDMIWLDAMDEQPQAFQFYKKLGYQYHSHEFLDYDLLFDEVRKMSQLYKIL